MATRPLGVDAAGALPARAGQAGIWTGLARFCRKKPLGAVGGAIMLLIVLAAIFAVQLQTHDPIATEAAHTLAPPG